MMIDGLAMSPSIADQNRDKGFAAVNQTFYISKDQIICKNLLRGLPACRRLLFPLLQAEKGRLRNAVANRVPASCWVPKILGTRCDRLTRSAYCLT